MTPAKQATTLMVGLGEVKISQDPAEVLTCLGLGSCVGVCMYDPVAKVAGMAHIVLPNSDGKPDKAGGKYADTAVPLLLEMMLKRGAIKSRVIVKIAGGAQISRSKGLGRCLPNRREKCRGRASGFRCQLHEDKGRRYWGTSRAHHAV